MGSVIEKKAFTWLGHERSNELVRKMSWRWLIRNLR